LTLRNSNWRGPSRVCGSGNAARGDETLSPAIQFLSGLFFTGTTAAKPARSSSCLPCDERPSG
jgi:hypothetical protein